MILLRVVISSLLIPLELWFQLILWTFALSDARVKAITNNFCVKSRYSLRLFGIATVPLATTTMHLSLHHFFRKKKIKVRNLSDDMKAIGFSL